MEINNTKQTLFDFDNAQERSKEELEEILNDLAEDIDDKGIPDIDIEDEEDDIDLEEKDDNITIEPIKDKDIFPANLF